MRCPSCAEPDDKVIDSRSVDNGTAIRRRRQCLACGNRFNTFERCEELPLFVVKRSGDRVPFDRRKVESGVMAAAKGRPLSEQQIAELVDGITERLRLHGGEVASEVIGVSVLDGLRDLDPVAYVRFASVYKGFDDPADFEREIGLLTKETEPKRH